MTTHELAKKLLGGPDFPAVIDITGGTGWVRDFVEISNARTVEGDTFSMADGRFTESTGPFIEIS